MDPLVHLTFLKGLLLQGRGTTEAFAVLPWSRGRLGH